MAGKSGAALASVGQLTDVDTTQRNPLGMILWDASAGKAYIYLQGVASTAARSIVTYNASFQSALSVTGAKGPVAVAMAATVASTYGWYQIFGPASGEFNGAAVSGAKVYSASTGKCDDAVVVGDQIDGAIVGATVSGAGAGSLFLAFPFMNGQG